ncbi:MAG: hypothetical protein PHV37_08605 [Candidatus Gastranaerophilales bacterium]|nr:hypothetical protein [Candidatus Gastranaerophilales bacterium]
MQDISLAQYISKQREKVGLSQTGLSKKSNLPLSVIEDIESGKELFLPSTHRQQLAKGLKLLPMDIKKYEKVIDSSFDTDMELVEFMRRAILGGETDELRCPICGSELTTKIVKMYDLEDNLVLHPKANCKKCPFQIK